MPKIFLSIVLLVYFTGIVHSQCDTLRNKPLLYLPDKEFWKGCLNDAGRIVTFPARWNGNQWAVALVTLGMGACAYGLDGVVEDAFAENHSEVISDVSRNFIEPFGSGIYTIPALGIMYGIGALSGKQKPQYVALKGIEAYLYTAILTTAIKQLTHRHRPYQDDPPNPYFWEGPMADIRYNSFPSGHTACAFAVATVIGSAYRKTIWVPLVCYSLASLVAAERLVNNAHWGSDVVIGAAIGIGVGLTVASSPVKNLAIVPVAPDGIGLTLVYRY
jgi:hypothetical protein